MKNLDFLVKTAGKTKKQIISEVMDILKGKEIKTVKPDTCHLWNEEYTKEDKNDINIDDIAVIDEFIMEGDTNYEINKIFGHEIPYFPVFAIPESTSREGAGYIIDENTAKLLRGTSRYHGTLSYKFDRKSIGVNKREEGKYTTPNNKGDNFTKQDTEMISKLRKEMRMIGKRIAEDI